MTLSVRLSPRLRPDAYRSVFKAHRRLHIPDFLHPPSAARLRDELAAATTWVRTIHLRAGQDVDITMAELDAMTAGEREALERSLVDDCTDSVRYVFDAVRITSELAAGRSLSPSMQAIQDFANSRAFLDFVRRLTGDDRVAFADAMGTRYLPGHFATAHGDELPGHRRLYAYVLNLTPDWRADDGGVLNFLDEDGHVAEGYVPKFNALNIFAVPQSHSVSVVSRFAKGQRISVTGWFHAAA